MDGGALMEVFNKYSPAEVNKNWSNSKFKSKNYLGGANLFRQPTEIATL